jgi:hypothetical protein
MDHSELGMGCGIVCGIPIDDIVHLFELLAREEKAQGKGSDEVCGMKVESSTSGRRISQDR